jgi:mRNA interferase MazF
LAGHSAISVSRGEVWWAALDRPIASEPGYDRPVLVISSAGFNHSRIRTVLAAGLTTNLGLADAPGNVFVASEETGLPRDSVVNISQILTVDKEFVPSRTGSLGTRAMSAVENGLRSVLEL